MRSHFALLLLFLPLPVLGASNIVNNSDFSASTDSNSGSVSNTGTFNNNWTRPGNYQWDISGGTLSGVDDVGALSTIQAINTTTSLTGVYDLAFNYSITDAAPTGPAGFRVQIYGVNTGTGTWSFSNWSTTNATLTGDATSTSLFDQVWTGDSGGTVSYAGPADVNLGSGYEFVVVRIAKESDTQFEASDVITIDDFSLTAAAVPEPGRGALLVAGGLVCAMRRRPRLK